MNTQTKELELQDTIRELTKKVKELEELVEQIAVPIIPSILPHTILVPFSGGLSQSGSK
ncbi:hypothetical protein [Bacillus sp. SA1-12]|uniref:hypothetical protein n=1 Tax=Bacillus sp. SA1-12 TaxID=1455638 RepID=UPI000B220A6B|nr:hypothetical protein [Bacillus sp. SA1-12]